MNNEEFLAEMKRRREAAGGASPQSLNDPASQVTITPLEPGADSGKGIVGFLIRKGIAKSTAQANQILIGVLVVAAVIIIWVNFF